MVEFWGEGAGGSSHVLWCGGVGSLAHRCPNRVPSMLVLPHARVVPVAPRRDSSLALEPRVLLRLRGRDHGHRDRVVRHRRFRAHCSCRVRLRKLFLVSSVTRFTVRLMLLRLCLSALSFLMRICVCYGGWMNALT